MGWSFVFVVAVLLAVAPRTASACVAFIEEHTGASTASFRVQQFERCDITEDKYRQVVRGWLAQRHPGAAAVTSLSLGRALGFPWISRHLANSALEHPHWRNQVARGPSGAHNAFVAAALSQPAFLGRLSVPFEGTPLVVTGASVEKVLVGPASQYSSTKQASHATVPFDAQVWLRLAPR